MGAAGLSVTTEPGISIFLTLLLSAAAFALPGFSERISGRIENYFCWLAERKRLAVAVVFGLVIAARLSLLALLPVPNPGIHDEFSYLLMGDTFAHGRLANPSHPMWMSFETFHVLWFPSYASKYPPAQGLVLALGQLLGHPWIGVLMSAAAMSAVTVWALQAWMPSRWAFLAGALTVLKLCIATYWINSYWGGAVAAFGGALAAGALGRLLRRGHSRSAILFAIGAAILLNSRPYEAAFFAIPIAAVFLRRFFGKANVTATAPRPWKSVFAPVGAVLLATIAGMGYYNWRVTGNVLETPYAWAVHTYDRSALFLWQKAKPPQHYNSRELDVFYNRWERENYNRKWDDVKEVSWTKLTRCNEILSWPALLLIVPGLSFVYRDRRVRLLVAILLLVAIGFFIAAWSSPHYPAPATVAFFAIIVQSMRHLRTLRVFGRPLGLALSRVVVLALVADVSLAAAQRISDPLGWGGSGLGDRAEIQHALARAPGKHLVMVRYAAGHSVHDEWVFNGADLDGTKVLWARDLGPEQDGKLFAYYKGRTVWLVEPGDSSVPVSLQPYRPGPVGDYEPEY
jgi:hypothetical protein